MIAFHRRATASTTSVIDQVPAERLDAPTPCESWTISDIIEHLVGNSHNMLDRLDQKSTVDDLAGLHEVVLAAYDDPEILARKFELAGIEVDGNSVIAVNAADVFIHGWDIARAAGLDVSFDEDLIAIVKGITSQFPDSVRGPNAGFAHARPISDDASPQDKLIAFLGRDPEWAPALAS
ncbi:TIGR03086 family metal-binding protein [Actinophytocola sediminis]